MKLKNLWNQLANGFETAIWNIGLAVVGFLTYFDFQVFQSVLPADSKLGEYMMYLGAAGLIVRFFITLPWVKPFKDALDVEMANRRSVAD